MIDKNLKAKELYTAGTKEDPLYGCQEASNRASGSRAKHVTVVSWQDVMFATWRVSKQGEFDLIRISIN